MSARVLRGFGALALLLAVLVGVPVALAVLGGNPLPAAITWESLRQALFAPDGGILLGLVTLVAGSPGGLRALGSERAGHPAVASALIRINLPGWPDPSGSPPLAALGGRHGGRAPRPVHRPARPHGARPPGDPDPERQAARAEKPAAGRPRPDRRVHVSSRANDLWSLGERYYGEAASGFGSRRPTRAYSPRTRPASVGWRLVVPGRNAAQGASRPTVTVGGARPCRRSLIASSARPIVARSLRANRPLNDPDEWPRVWSVSSPACERRAGRATRAEG